MYYGYARVSTDTQDLNRQLNALDGYAERQGITFEKVYSEKYTGRELNRPQFVKLIKRVKTGDVIVFDEISRMARDAEEGFRLYTQLFHQGVSLVFLECRALDTDNFRKAQTIAYTGNEIADTFIDAVNKILLLVAEQQVKQAFENAESEVNYLSMRTSGGMRAAGACNTTDADGNVVQGSISRALTGKHYNSKATRIKERIRRNCKDFGGSASDAECIAMCQCSRATFYRVKAEIKTEQE